MTKYIRKPIVVEAYRIPWGGGLENIPDWLNKALLNGVVRVHSTKVGWVDYLEIETAEGTIKACSGDYIVKEVIRGKIYPCREKIFGETYDFIES